MKLSNAFKHLGKIIAFGILIAIFSLVFSIYWEISKGDSADYNDLKEAIVQYGNDLNEMREYLYLPQNEYDFFKSEASEIQTDIQPEEREEPYITGVSMFAEDLAATKNLAQNQTDAQEKLSGIINEVSFLSQLEDLGLAMDQNPEATEHYVAAKVMNGSTPLAQIMLDLKEDHFSLQSITGKDTLIISQGETPSQKIIAYLEANKDKIVKMQTTLASRQEEIKSLLIEGGVNSTLKKNNLSVNIDPVETEAGFETYITNTDGSPLLTVLLDRQTARFIMEEVTYMDSEQLRVPFTEKLTTLDGLSDYVQEIKNKKRQLEAYLKGSEFAGAFGSSNIESLAGREIEGRTYYDLSYKESENEEILGSIIFDEATGDVSFLKQGETEEMLLEDILGSKKKP